MAREEREQEKEKEAEPIPQPGPLKIVWAARRTKTLADENKKHKLSMFPLSHLLSF
ncbi:hypothetical protein HPP92_002514 [Vanilla planifolia]|uniref:Uncharacterized protein n=1 Tax=Vanilla planifolia TaxID=51239 RepID=A0A835SEU1_VANPL|nr:hypothetical protein HPP92_002514 [Vanilla planifolia]